MSIYDVPLTQLVELDNLMNDDDLLVNEWLEAYDNDEDQALEDLIDSIFDDLLDKYNYDEDNEDYNAIYWFVKGVKSIPKPADHLIPPKRYVDSDEYKARINKEKDDTLFNDLHKIKHKDVFDEYHKRRAQIKFNYQLNKDNITIHSSKVNYHQMLNDLINNNPLKRPLPTTEMKPLKPYHQKLFDAHSNELIDYFKNLGHDLVNKDVKYLVVNVPHDYNQAERLLFQHRFQYQSSKVVIKNKNVDPIVCTSLMTLNHWMTFSIISRKLYLSQSVNLLN